jgi:hypothetical protein
MNWETIQKYNKVKTQINKNIIRRGEPFEVYKHTYTPTHTHAHSWERETLRRKGKK